MAAVTVGALVSVGTAVYASKQAKKQQERAIAAQQDQMEALDPFAQHRPEYAERLSQLANDPSYITNTAAFKARLQGADRTMASQGYTGSGNALVAAADAGAAAYQQEFDNLSMLAGVGQGQGARASAYGTGAAAEAGANDNKLSAIAGVGNTLANLATVWGGRSNPTPVTPPGNTGTVGSLTNFGNNLDNFSNWS